MMATGISVIAYVSEADPTQGFTFCLLLTLLPLFYWSPPWMLVWHILGTTIPPSVMIVLAAETDRTKVSSLVAAAIAAVLAVVSYTLFQKAKQQIELLNLELMKSATRDHVTGLLSRASWYILAAKALREAAVSKLPVSLLYVDLDEFKRVNDNHGHAVGDRALLLTADCLKRVLPEWAILARIGGEEFVALLPGRNVDAAADIAELFHVEFRKMNALPLALTASIGIAGYEPNETLERFVDRADRAMFRAKGSGRNATAVDPGGARAGPGFDPRSPARGGDALELRLDREDPNVIGTSSTPAPRY
jgi:diguanylate cyclase (GGDEF)-like protein